jgi:methionyl-tRNA formyltransferase
LNIIYFGSSDFSVPFLEHIDDSSHNIAGVFTYTDKKRGRGRKVSANPVKMCANGRGLDVFEIKSFDDDFYNKLSGIDFDYAVVVSFGMILPEEIFKRWPGVWLNVHPSMLPEYRGPSPMISALLDGKDRTGVTINSVVYEVDTGMIYAQTAFNIEKTDNLDRLEEKAVIFGAPLLINVLDLIENYDYKPLPQTDDDITYTVKTTQEDLVIDWGRPAEEVVNRIRAFSTRPGAHTQFGKQRLKILAAHIADVDASGKAPGVVVSADKKEGILIACGDGRLVGLDMLQPQGRKPMDAKSFINGYRISVGTILGARIN